MTDSGDARNEDGPSPRAERPPAMEVQRLTREDGRALLLFTWPDDRD